METKERTFNFGPFTLAALCFVAIADVAIPVWLDGGNDESIYLGLSFGQVGVAIMWVYAARQFTWQRLLICYAVSVAMAGYYLWCDFSLGTEEEVAMIVVIWLIPTTVALVLLAAVRWYLHVQMRSVADGGQPPRFRIGHLIIATTVLAIISLVVRVALPELRRVFDPTVVTLLIQTVLFYVVAALLTRQAIALFWKLGLLAILTLVATWILGWTAGRGDASTLNFVEATVLAVFLVAFHLDGVHKPATIELDDSIELIPWIDEIVE